MTPKRLQNIWPTFFSIVGIANIFTMVPQTYKIIMEKSVEGLSLPMLLIYLLVQLTFAFNGKFAGDRRQYILLILASVSSLIPIVLYFTYKQW